MKQNIKQANLNIKLKDLFHRWLEITTTFHHLTKQEIKVLGLLLYYNYKYKKEITNERLIWKMVFELETRKLIVKELGITDAVFRNILTKLRKIGVIKDNRIVKTFIPELGLDSKNFKVIFNFNILHG